MKKISLLTIVSIVLSTLIPTQSIKTMEQNNNPQISESRENNALFKAVIDYNVPAAIRALQRGADINTQSFSCIYRHTPLHLAVMMGHDKMVDTLISHKANSNIQSSDGSTPLILAASGTFANLYIIKEIICAGADIEIKDHNNRTAFEQIKTDYVRTVFLNAVAERDNKIKALKAHL